MNFIVSEIMPENIIKELSNYGNVYLGGKLDIESFDVSHHPDMQIHFVNERHAFCEAGLYDYYRSILPYYVKLEKGASVSNVTYPNDCAYNVARVADYVICNLRTAEKKIIEYYRDNLLNIVNVKQGYSKCNICQISENTFLTEDEGIMRAMYGLSGIKALHIPVGDVSLGGFDYGFIGGASGYIDGKVFLCGKASRNVSNTLKLCNVDYVELSQSKLYDYGSILQFI